MTRSTPITPAEYKQLKVEEVPVFVYSSINKFLAVAKEVRGKLVIPLDQLREELDKYYTTHEHRDTGIELALQQYRKLGWGVTLSVFDWDDPDPEVIYFQAD